MATFKPSVTMNPSLSGKTIQFVDNSNYSDANPVTINNVQSRVLLIKDGFGNTLDTLTFATGQTTVTLNVTTDHYLNVLLTWTLADSSVVTNTLNFHTDNIFYNGLIANSKADFGCCSGSSDLDNMKAVACDILSEFYFEYGFASNSETLINAADTLVS